MAQFPDPTLPGLLTAEGGDGFLEGKMLIAMPNIGDERFERTLIYICVHNSEGAMGIIVNKAADNITFPALLDQLAIEVKKPVTSSPLQGPVLVGGPVEMGRGFVLHSGDYYSQDSTLPVDHGVALTATIDVLHAIAQGEGPSHAILALGYAGWAAGQLEAEIQANGWLHCEADSDLLFGADVEKKYSSALAKLGIDLTLLSGNAGHA